MQQASVLRPRDFLCRIIFSMLHTLNFWSFLLRLISSQLGANTKLKLSSSGSVPGTRAVGVYMVCLWVTVLRSQNHVPCNTSLRKSFASVICDGISLTKVAFERFEGVFVVRYLSYSRRSGDGFESVRVKDGGPTNANKCRDHIKKSRARKSRLVFYLMSTSVTLPELEMGTETGAEMDEYFDFGAAAPDEDESEYEPDHY